MYIDHSFIHSSEFYLRAEKRGHAMPMVEQQQQQQQRLMILSPHPPQYLSTLPYLTHFSHSYLSFL